jgi:hypothetical protein
MMLGHNYNFMRRWSWQPSAWAPWTSDKILFEPTLNVPSGPGNAHDRVSKFHLKKFNPACFDPYESAGHRMP